MQTHARPGIDRRGEQMIIAAGYVETSSGTTERYAPHIGGDRA